MLLRLQLLSINLITTILLILFLCLGSQNLDKRYKLNLLFTDTVQLPIGFLVGTSFTLGFLSGGISSTFMNNHKT